MKKNIHFLNLFLILFLLPFLLAPALADASSLSIGTITPNANTPAGSTISFQINAPDVSNPSYILSDSLPGSTLSNSNISNTGRFSWATGATDIGTHNITFTVIDSYGFRSTLTQTLVVGPFSALSIQNLSPSTNIFPNNVLSFSVGAQGFSNPSFLISDTFAGSSISSSNISSAGNVAWTPKTSDVGVHNLSIRVSASNGRTDTLYQTITVNGISVQNTSGSNISAGVPVTLTITPYGLTSPTYTLGDSLRNNTLDNGNLNGSNFTWTPQTQDIGTHNISINAIDINNTTASTQLTLTVTGNGAVSSAKGDGFIFNKPLDLGSTGNDVTELQKRLTAEGLYSGPITSYYGSLTRAAVILYQSAHGINTLGNVGPATRTSLNKK
ncbi:MAG: peptidoglycan-binding domain-containing protein [Candidatus Pacebacteria bacterium]|nr:peptidoglycan-binding domain-containing protein [Candidatus Paceibacterota bacterium]